MAYLYCDTIQETVAYGTLGVTGNYSYTFADTPVGGLTHREEFTLKNTDTLPALIRVLETSGDFIYNIKQIPAVLSPGDTARFTVAFAPDYEGMHHGSLYIKTEGGDEISFAFNGFCTEAEESSEKPADPVSHTNLEFWEEIAHDTESSSSSILQIKGTKENISAGIVPKGSGAFFLTDQAGKRGEYAADLQLKGQPVSGNYAAAAGGLNNSVTGECAFSGAGSGNTVSGNCAGSAGGRNNTVSADFSAVLGGDGNTVAVPDDGLGHSFAGCAAGAQITESYSGILTGSKNRITAQNSFIASGSENTVSGASSALVTGTGNSAEASYNFLGSGTDNHIRAESSVIGSGKTNTVAGEQSAVITGSGNTVSSSGSFTGTGSDNRINSADSAVLAGSQNTLENGEGNIILSGKNQNSTDSSHAILTGIENSLNTSESCVLLGKSNAVSGSSFSLVHGESNTLTDAEYSAVYGKGNTASSGTCVLLRGSDLTADASYIDGCGKEGSDLGAGYHRFISHSDKEQTVQSGEILLIAQENQSAGVYTNTSTFKKYLRTADGTDLMIPANAVMQYDLSIFLTDASSGNSVHITGSGSTSIDEVTPQLQLESWHTSGGSSSDIPEAELTGPSHSELTFMLPASLANYSGGAVLKYLIITVK